MREITDTRENLLLSSEMADVFNYAIAEWGNSGTPPRDLMAKVVDLLLQETFRSINRHQCLALAHHVVGDQTLATWSYSSQKSPAMP